MRKIDIKQENLRIIQFIQNYLKSAKCDKVVLGLSGGVDSAVVAALASEALGCDNVYCVIMPHIAGNQDNVIDAVRYAEALNVNYEIIDITPYVDQYFWDNEQDASRMRRGNFMARMRMCILFDLSVKYGALVIGTGNLSEFLTGYSTQFGDNACAFEPIGHLFKVEVYELARELNVRPEIIDKIPTADFWQGQTDEEEMRINYYSLDEILYLLYKKTLSIEDVIKKGHLRADVERAVELYERSSFKRKMPPTIEEFEN